MTEHFGHGLFAELAFQDFQGLDHRNPGVNHHSHLTGKKGHILQAHKLEEAQGHLLGTPLGFSAAAATSLGCPHFTGLLCKSSSNSSCRGDAARAVFRSMAPEK